MLSKKRLAQDYGNDVVWYDKRRRLGLRLSFTHYIITATKLHVRTGFLSVKEESLELYKVTDYTLLLPFKQRLFDCGTISIKSNDKTDPIQDLISIKKPREVLNVLEQYVTGERKKYGVHGRDMVGSSGFVHDCDHM